MASKRLEFLEAAAIEYEAAIDWYFERSPVAAQKFAAEVSRALDNVEQSPQRWSLFALYPQVFPATLSLHSYLSRTAIHHSIIAVAHGHRRPDYWKQRL